MLSLKHTLPLHGGDIQYAARRYGICAEQWIDLSTGINPEPYPIPHIPNHVFEDLPYWQPHFLEAANAYFGQEHFLAVAGSQTVIQILPEVLNCFGKRHVLVPAVGYREHAQQWQRSENTVTEYSCLNYPSMIEAIEQKLTVDNSQHVVIINPNNPTGILLDKAQLVLWASRLSQGAMLIVDEAFIDMTKEASLLSMKHIPDNIIILRSFGKYFGLAGIRLGFVFAQPPLLKHLQDKMGLWQVNGPAQFIASHAMKNAQWQAMATKRIAENAAITQQLFEPLVKAFPISLLVNRGLFLSYCMSLDWALALNHALAQSAILTRVVILPGENALLRVGCVNTSNKQTVEYVARIISDLSVLDDLQAVLSFEQK